ncbi:MAG TPA: hypothetical protein PKY30_24815, partial [Myxococcota bacterium]|nr:hypothetical protein [Myxococcota bacterium]
DIHQGGYGDCYFLAVLALIAQRRPDHLRQMVRPDGRGGAVVRFYRFEERRRCVPVDVVVSPELLYNGPQRTPGVNGGYELRAAHIRGALQYADWYGLLRGNILELHRRDRWDLARWVPILEKAYVRFVEQYGLYGDTPPTSALSGYQQVDVGGKSHLLMPMLFGPEMFGAERRGAVDVSDQEGRDHRRVLELLLRQALRGHNHALLVFSAQTEHLSQRLNLQIAMAYHHPSWKTLSSTEQTQLVDVVRLYREARTGTVAERVAADTSYSAALRKAVNRASAPGLLALANKAPFSDVVRLALSLSGGVKGQRYLVLAHAYAVVGVNIVFRRGWTGQPEVDEAASTVTLSNPWHGGEPDLTGRRQPLRTGDGIPNG